MPCTKFIIVFFFFWLGALDLLVFILLKFLYFMEVNISFAKDGKEHFSIHISERLVFLNVVFNPYFNCIIPSGENTRLILCILQ